MEELTEEEILRQATLTQSGEIEAGVIMTFSTSEINNAVYKYKKDAENILNVNAKFAVLNKDCTYSIRFELFQNDQSLLQEQTSPYFNGDVMIKTDIGYCANGNLKIILPDMEIKNYALRMTLVRLVTVKKSFGVKAIAQSERTIYFEVEEA